MNLYETLREKYPDFYYHGYTVAEDEREVRIEYSFEIKNLSCFNPSWVFYKNTSETVGQSSVFKNMVFSLGLVELVSYWKLTCSPKVFIKDNYLDSEQILWWKKLYFGGLGEFFYVNGITADFNNFMTIEPLGEKVLTEKENREGSGILVPIGGGKDSAVSLEVLSPLKDAVTPYIINGRGATENTCIKAGFCSDNIHVVKRTLDKSMIELNKKGFLNGHTPFSAIVAFSSLIDAYLSHKKYIALSNESSANESTVLGSDVNHQFSKGFEFEKAFREYNEKYLKTDISYFSLLRPLSEFQIAMLFSQYKKYHSIFRSCNAGSKTDSWCSNCPKCLFVYIILSPFLTREELVGIFGEDLFEKEGLLTTFKKLNGELPDKPFECVGSRDEIACALTLAIEKYEKSQEKLPVLLAHFKEHGKKASDPLKYVEFYDEENFLPKVFDALLKEELARRYHDALCN